MNNNVKITQITSATGKKFIKIYGLGDDNKIYQWDSENWIIFEDKYKKLNDLDNEICKLFDAIARSKSEKETKQIIKKQDELKSKYYKIKGNYN